jgi:DNA-binding response OmpR family regulator
MKVLVVEDEHKIANALKQGLEQENFAVDVMYDGTSGFDLASTEEYDLIILDRLLPGMDGVTISKSLREKKIHTPILILTAKGQIEDRVEGLDSGADDYMVKPFAFSELLARIRAISRRPKVTIQTLLTVEDITLDTKTFEVKRGKTRIPLSSKEYALLDYLMRHHNQVVTKEQIINNVWNYDANVLPNSVEVYIKHLRDKVDSLVPDQPLIHTVRGFGYKIGAKK